MRVLWGGSGCGVFEVLREKGRRGGGDSWCGGGRLRELVEGLGVLWLLVSRTASLAEGHGDEH